MIKDDRGNPVKSCYKAPPGPPCCQKSRQSLCQLATLQEEPSRQQPKKEPRRPRLWVRVRREPRAGRRREVGEPPEDARADLGLLDGKHVRGRQPRPGRAHAKQLELLFNSLNPTSDFFNPFRPDCKMIF